MLLNVSFEKTISLEVQVPDGTDVMDLDAVVSAIQESEEMGYLDEWLDDQPAVGYRIDDAAGNALFGADDRLVFEARPGA